MRAASPGRSVSLTDTLYTEYLSATFFGTEFAASTTAAFPEAPLIVDHQHRRRLSHFTALHLLQSNEPLHSPAMTTAEMEQRIAAHLSTSPFLFLLDAALSSSSKLALVDNPDSATSRTHTYMALLLRSLSFGASLARIGCDAGSSRVAVLVHNSTPVFDIHMAAAAVGCAVRACPYAPRVRWLTHSCRL